MNSTDQRRWEQAKDQGAQARRAGKPYGANPYRGNSETVRRLREAWHIGWQEGRK